VKPAMNFGVTYTEWNSWLSDARKCYLMTSLLYEIIWIVRAFWHLWERKTCCRRLDVRNESLSTFPKTKKRCNESNYSLEIRSDDLLHIVCSSVEKLFSQRILHLPQRRWHLEFTSISLKTCGTLESFQTSAYW